MNCESPAAINFDAIHETLYPDLSCVYTRGGDQVINVPVNRGRSTLVDDDGAGARIENASVDFIIPAEPLQSLAHSSEPVTPQKGDTVTIWQIDGFSRACQVYELMTPPYSPHDHNGEFFRLHTQMIESRPT